MSTGMNKRRLKLARTSEVRFRNKHSWCDGMSFLSGYQRGFAQAETDAKTRERRAALRACSCTVKT